MLKQFSGPTGSVLAGACCLGFAPFLAALSAIGAGFLINDLILIPIFVLFLGITLWGLYSSMKRHKNTAPLILGAASAVVAFAALWLFTPLSYLALATLFAASVWDMVLLRQSSQEATG
jgi:mercuric ion transport protein